MIDQPPDPLQSRALSKSDWLDHIPAKEVPITDGVVKPPKEDLPPEPAEGGREMQDAMASEALENSKQRRQLQFNYSEKAYGLVCGCLFGWACMLAASGMVNGVRGQPLWSDKVIMAVTTGVTVSVLAAFLSVIRGLFSDAALNGHEKGQAKPPKK
ncbi:hypothetical protein [Delftia acidovorans]